MAGNRRKAAKPAKKKAGPKFTRKQQAKFVGLLRQRAEARNSALGGSGEDGNPQ